MDTCAMRMYNNILFQYIYHQLKFVLFLMNKLRITKQNTSYYNNRYLLKRTYIIL